MNSNIFPLVKQVSYETIAEDIIGMRPGERFEDAARRHLIEQRVKKIAKIRLKMGSSR